MSTWMRTGHRWLPLAPLALMVVSGIWLFRVPYMGCPKGRAA